MKSVLRILIFLILCTSIPRAQLRVEGQASTAFVKANDGPSQYSFDGGNGSFAWRLDLFSDAIVSENITFLSNLRVIQDQIPHFDLFAIRVADIASSGVSVQAGEIDIPFGNLSENRFPKENPFLDLPLMNEHITALCRSDYKLWTLIQEYQIAGDGVCLLDQGLYDVGVKAYGSIGMFDYSVALINGMISSTGTYSPNGLNPNGGYGKVFRGAITPMTGLTLGASYAIGPFMKNESDLIIDSDGNADTSAFFGISPDNYLQKIIGGDLSFSLEHFYFSGEIISNTWEYLDGVNLKAFSYSAEARYAFTPRVSGAIRAGGISFNMVSGMKELNAFFQPVLYTGKWDHDVFRLEGAVAYKLDRALLLKLGYEINRTFDLPRDPVDNVMFAQTVLSF